MRTPHLQWSVGRFRFASAAAVGTPKMGYRPDSGEIAVAMTAGEVVVGGGT